MNGPTYIRKAWRLSLAVLLLTALLIHPCWACWTYSSLEERASHCHVIVTGKVVKVSTDLYGPVDEGASASEARRLPPRGKEWMGGVFFWHYHLSQSARFVVLVVAVALMGAGVVLRRRVSKRRMLAMALTGAVVAVAVGCSTGLHIWSPGESTESPTSYRLADIKVDKVLKNDLEGLDIHPGDELTLSMAGSKPRISIEFSFKAGDEGVWMLSRGPTHFIASRPDCLEGYDRQGAIEAILTTLRAKYEAAKAKEIPLQEKAWVEMLSMSACSRETADAAMGKAIPPDVDLGKLRVVNLETSAERMRALFIDTTGRIYSGVPYFAHGEWSPDGLLSVSTRIERGCFVGSNVVDRSGKLLFDNTYDSIRGYAEGLFLVSKNDRWGCVDASGKEVVPCIYTSITDFCGGIARAEKDDQEFLIDVTGKVVLFSAKGQQSISWSSEGWAAVNFYGNCGYVDRTGKVVLDTTNKGYVAEKPFKEGLARVWIREQTPQRWGFIDRQGDLVIQARFASVEDFSEGMAAFTNDGGKTWGYIDRNGSTAIAPRFTSAGPFAEGLALVQQSGWKRRPPVHADDPRMKLSANAPQYHQGPQDVFIDKKGTVVIALPFDSAQPFVNGLARVMCYQHGGRFDALIDKTGKVVFVIFNEPPRKTAAAAGD